MPDGHVSLWRLVSLDYQFFVNNRKAYGLFTAICSSLLFSLIACSDLGLGTDEAEEDFGVWQVKTMVAIIFSMLSENCGKWSIYTECWNFFFLDEWPVELSFLSNLWPWLCLNFPLCCRSHIYWPWNCEIQVRNRSLVSAFVTVHYNQSWVSSAAEKACKCFPAVTMEVGWILRKVTVYSVIWCTDHS